jgi:carotenoid cleavage dioxygenase-like enzyme
MTFTLDRRHFLAAGLAAVGTAIITPDMALAGAAPPVWLPAVRDVEADIPEQAMRLVHGRAPAGFSGRLYRNGPAKFRRGTTAAGHWFDGDGLIRKFQIADGQARLTARFVDTPKRRLETELGAMVQPGFGTPAGPGARIGNADDVNAANTSVMLAGGELLALWEGGSPMRIDPDNLATRGFKTFRDDLRYMPFQAHPRTEPGGAIWNLGAVGAQTIAWKLNADGSLAKAEVFELPRRSYFHDFTATARHLIIVLQPWVNDRFALPLATNMSWRPELGTQVLVIEKDDFSRRRTFELPAFSFFHLGDAWEESDGTIRFDGAFEADPSFGQHAASALIRGEHVATPRPVLTQVVLRPNGRAELIRAVTDAEFPSSDKRRSGLSRSATIHVAHYRGPFPHGIAIWDWARGHDSAFDFGNHQLVEEFLFAPRGEGERDGWLIGTTLNLARRATELHLLDAANVAAGPVATWRASVPLPLTFHGTFAA